MGGRLQVERGEREALHDLQPGRGIHPAHGGDPQVVFGVMTIRGQEGKGMKITAYFLIRGQEIQPLIDCNDDAHQYEFTKLDHTSEETKKMLYMYWCSDGPLGGEAYLDGAVYK